ncbi:MAG: DnaJ domain-containing protein [Nitrososphaeraceae archaeon]|nr:DnaJ domain-containing protein [Nitrososphaeraceae archaeon]MDW0167361.1 DnaJ domain-containing protein [Nitrososphaeraceae archaeon]
MDDYYGALELNKNASLDEIRKSFRTLALKYHPDKNKNEGSKEKFMKIVEAYEVLSNANGKKNYDESITIKKNTPRYDFSWTPSADFDKVYSYSRIKNTYGGGGGIWDIGEKASKAMWKATIILLASLASMALLILFLP